MKKFISIFVALCMLLSFAAFAENADTKNTVTEDPDMMEDITVITLSDDGITIDGDGAEVSDDGVLISRSGEYSLSGKLSAGSVVIDCSRDEANQTKVILHLAGVDITGAAKPAIYCIHSPKRLSVQVDAGTDNVLSVDETVQVDEVTSGAAFFSKSDVTIGGEGNLTVNGNRKSGIVSKDDLRIKGSVNLTVNAATNGISGKDSVEILGGTITVVAINDGIRSMGENGMITVSDGTINITCGDDPFKATQGIEFAGGVVNITLVETEEA